MIQRPDVNQTGVRLLFGSDIKFYVWDNVAIALRMEEGEVTSLLFIVSGRPPLQTSSIHRSAVVHSSSCSGFIFQVLKFDPEKLKKNLTFCAQENRPYTQNSFQSFDEAEKIVKRLWPDYPGPLEKEISLQD